ncbi:MAG TPA: chorismate-binding protein, partial [Rhodocyclaceae bacterium]|nr:chorismate-binding protein [Rhodocyclaceae bacterium]
MTEAEFNALAAQGYNRIPVTVDTFADLDTPLSVYLKLANAPNTYLLESVQGGERFGRYSIIGLACSTRIEARGRSVMLLTNDRVVERRDDTNPLDYVAEFKARIKVPPRDRLPRFAGGLVGCFGYDTVRYIEPRLASTHKPDALGTPDVLLLLSEEIAIVDNLSGKLTLVVYAEPQVPDAYARATRRLKELIGRLREPVSIPAEAPGAPAEAVSSFGEAAFKDAVRKAKHYIVEGDIMQVVLAQRMSKPFAASPLALYRAIRSLNPSPYMFYFNFED